MKSFVGRRRRGGTSPDAGMGLTEVLVALVILAMVMAAATALFINALRTGRDLDQRAFAVQLANEYLESARAAGTAPLTSCPGTGATAPSRLVAGRLTSAVDATWQGPPGDLVRLTLDETVPLSMSDLTDCDPDAVTGQYPVPVTYPDVEEGGTTFLGYSFVGECFAPDASVGAADCIASRAQPNVRLFRIVVLVSWSEPAGACVGGCHYAISTLMDPVTGDPVYGPTAFDDGPTDPQDPDDPFVTYANEAVLIGVNRLIVNDDFTKTFRYKTIQVKDVPGEGTAELLTSANCSSLPAEDRIYGCVRFVPEVNLTGVGNFQYRLEGVTGDVSNWGTVSVNVLIPPPPVAEDDPEPGLVQGNSAEYFVVRNDSYWPLGGFAGISLVDVQPADQLSSVAVVPAADPGDWKITYTAPSTFVGTLSVTYRLTDSWGQTSDAVVTVTVTAPPPGACTPNPDGPTSVAVGGSVTLNVLANDSCPPPVTLNAASLGVALPPTNGTATPGSGGNLTYSGATVPGTYLIGYTAQDSVGRPVASTWTVVVNSGLVARDDGTPASPALSLDERTTGLVNILSNDTCPAVNSPCRVYIVSASDSGGRVRMTNNNYATSGYARIENSTQIRFSAGRVSGADYRDGIIIYRLVDRTNNAIVSNDATIFVRILDD